MINMKNKSLIFGFVVMLVIGTIIGLVIATRFNISTNADAQKQATSAVQGMGASDLENAIINVSDRVGKAVVSISTEVTQKTSAGRRFYSQTPRRSPFFGDQFGGNDDLFNKFFEDFFGEIPEREFKQRGLGSGVIIDSEGFILTNEHVVRDADKITVTLPDGREFDAKIKGKDERSDLAVVKIESKNLPYAKLGDSDNLKIGQWVVAIGNPFGAYLKNNEPTVTVGVISALHRTLGATMRRDSDYTDLIQTDAAINPGNSGGPLVNLYGEIIGINVAIFSTSGGYQGIGFAIPANNAKRIVSSLIEGKEIEYGWLGVTVQDLNENLGDYFGIKEKKGALVNKVLKDGPAEKAGLKESDVIVKFQGEPIANIRELIKKVGDTEVGKKVKIQVVSNNTTKDLEVVLGKRPANIDELEAGEAGVTSSEYFRGIKVANISAEIAKYYKQPEAEGVIIVDVEAGSPAEDAGLSQGDIIQEIERQPIKNISDYNSVIAKIKADKNILVRTNTGYFILKSKQ